MQHDRTKGARGFCASRHSYFNSELAAFVEKAGDNKRTADYKNVQPMASATYLYSEQ